MTLKEQAEEALTKGFASVTDLPLDLQLRLKAMGGRPPTTRKSVEKRLRALIGRETDGAEVVTRVATATATSVDLLRAALKDRYTRDLTRKVIFDLDAKEVVL